VSISNAKPDNETIEVSLFGPGVGESLCVHMGAQGWVIVDSCINPATKKAVALEYLYSIGVNPETDVKLVVISHWHDDHVRGMSDIVRCCVNAQVAISSALLEKEFLVLKSMFDESPLPAGMTSGLGELSKTIDILIPRLKNKAKPCCLIMVGPFQDILNLNGVKIKSLSPSSASVVQSKLELSTAKRKLTQHKNTLPKPTANLNAIALWVESPQANILLGADLEVHAHLQLGWDAVVNSPARGNGKALVVKVPHHGSSNGHCDDVWDKMVDPNNPISILTAYNRSNLPRDADIERLKGITNRLYSTTIKKTKPPKRPKVVEGFVAGIAKNREVYASQMGHIQLRIDSAGEVVVNLNHAAVKF
tara:strand:+ start:22869 stop:23957 length:1089 start_codon:yes stop_codon:yes gene_type:complete